MMKKLIRKIGLSFNLGRSLFRASVIHLMFALFGAEKMKISAYSQAEKVYHIAVCTVWYLSAYSLKVVIGEFVVRMPMCSCATRRMKMEKPTMKSRPARRPDLPSGNHDQKSRD